LSAQTLSPDERRIKDAITAAREEQIAYLQRIVDIPSATLDTAGVKKVGAVFKATFDSLGFTTTWAVMPDSLRRAGHFIADHRGKPGAVRILLIGHLDTVVEPDGPTWVRQDSMAAGVGSGDMKGGDVIILYALKALAKAGKLKDMNVTVVFTGDEEAAGLPIEVSRRDLIHAAQRNDIALAFEGGNRSDITVGRRGASAWRVVATGRQAHSAGVFGNGAGFGAIYELARILNAFREQFSNEQYLTMNTATVVGGTDVVYDTVAVSGTTASKLNIIPKAAVAHGDLRFISEEQKERTRARMREIVSHHLNGTGAEINFTDEYPAMSPTMGNARLLAVYDSVSRALGYGAVEALDPGRRGAGDVSFVAPLIDGLDGLGPLGTGAHAPGERVSLRTLPMQTERAALLFYRLASRPASQFTRTNSAGGH
ncbi:MAG TPA: M20/M25/M40 family metallo-hydrolase, partial [Gemmatimonadales bacterium]